MSNDKHRSLARRTAWLRMAGRGWRAPDAERTEGTNPTGFATGVRHAPRIDDDILRLEAEGSVALVRSGTSRSSRTCVVATPAGLAALAATLARHGEDFGDASHLPRFRSDRKPRAAARAERTVRERSMGYGR